MRKRHFEDAKVARWECESAIITKPTNVIKSECRKKKMKYSLLLSKSVRFFFVREITVLDIFNIMPNGFCHYRVQVCIPTEKARAEALGHT